MDKDTFVTVMLILIGVLFILRMIFWVLFQIGQIKLKKYLLAQEHAEWKRKWENEDAN